MNYIITTRQVITNRYLVKDVETETDAFEAIGTDKSDELYNDYDNDSDWEAEEVNDDYED